MRLIELMEKVKQLRIPQLIFHELMATEVDTVGQDSPQKKAIMADELRRAVKTNNIYKAPLSDDSKIYLATVALPNLIDIARDNQNQRLESMLTKFQSRLNDKLKQG